tara:strand:+ start:794 stop:997 length:204 start_codon:yes stop_codon:yes gene_type:complete
MLEAKKLVKRFLHNPHPKLFSILGKVKIYDAERGMEMIIESFDLTPSPALLFCLPSNISCEANLKVF